MPELSTGMAKRGINPNVMPEMLALIKPLTVVDIEREVMGSCVVVCSNALFQVRSSLYLRPDAYFLPPKCKCIS